MTGQCVGKLEGSAGVGKAIARWEAGGWLYMNSIPSRPDVEQEKWGYAQLSLGQKLSLAAWNPAVKLPI